VRWDGMEWGKAGYLQQAIHHHLLTAEADTVIQLPARTVEEEASKVIVGWR
jgi:hypothetical protein